MTVKKYFVKGSEEDFPEKTQNTSYIERFNLTLRQHVAYLGTGQNPGVLLYTGVR
jgi:IS1 family transposase